MDQLHLDVRGGGDGRRSGAFVHHRRAVVDVTDGSSGVRRACLCSIDPLVCREGFTVGRGRTRTIGVGGEFERFYSVGDLGLGGGFAVIRSVRVSFRLGRRGEGHSQVRRGHLVFFLDSDIPTDDLDLQKVNSQLLPRLLQVILGPAAHTLIVLLRPPPIHPQRDEHLASKLISPTRLADREGRDRPPMHRSRSGPRPSGVTGQQTRARSGIRLRMKMRLSGGGEELVELGERRRNRSSARRGVGGQ